MKLSICIPTHDGRVAPLRAAIDGILGGIEIVLPDGVTVRLGPAVDEAALRRVLAALGRR